MSSLFMYLFIYFCKSNLSRLCGLGGSSPLVSIVFDYAVNKEFGLLVLLRATRIVSLIQVGLSDPSVIKQVTICS